MWFDVGVLLLFPTLLVWTLYCMRWCEFWIMVVLSVAHLWIAFDRYCRGREIKWYRVADGVAILFGVTFVWRSVEDLDTAPSSTAKIALDVVLIVLGAVLVVGHVLKLFNPKMEYYDCSTLRWNTATDASPC